MIKKLLNLIYEALGKMMGYKSITDAFDLNDSAVSDEMSDAMELWKDMYKDESPWLDDLKGIYSLGLPKQICQSIQQQTLSEMETSITEPGVDDETSEDKNDALDTRAKFLNDVYIKRLVKKLPQSFEKGLALGGMIIKPYMSGGQLYLDFNYQGEFYPISFDDDGNIIDIAFFDQFTSGKYIFTKIERQTFSQDKKMVVVENKAFKAQIRNTDDETEQELGQEIPLASVNRWSGISEEPVIIDNVEKPLYGYFKVPLANNVDLKSPLGMSIFSPAISLIQRADEQFSRLDWEYKGGQLAIDVDPTAVTYSEGYYGTLTNLDDVQDRLYRRLDMGADDTYKAWSPALRDANYISGLNVYTNKIEDMLGLARGTLSQVESEARTATEIKLLKQRTYITVSALQEALEQCLLDSVYAMNVFTELYNLAPAGDYDTNIDWKDSILTDTDTELEQKLNLQNAGILSKAEVRAWYTGESIEAAQLEIDKMQEQNQANMLNDLFTSQATNNENTLESGENDIDNIDKNVDKSNPESSEEE